MGLHTLLDSFEPIHGVLLCEGEDIDPSWYSADMSSLSPEELEEVKLAHSSDSAFDHAKDSIELQLARRCLERCIPYLGICRGSQVLNVACGGSLYQDVELELSRKAGVEIKHMDYSNYDGHRHPISVVPGTPLEEWFHQSLYERGGGTELHVNSYHHQGVQRLAARFQPMAHAPDGLVEAFYDPDAYDPENGKFIVGLQFHPERMRHHHDGAPAGLDHSSISHELLFDYPECPRAYQEFARAILAYQRKVYQVNTATKKESNIARVGSGQLDGKMQAQLKSIVRSFSVARAVYEEETQLKRYPSLGHMRDAGQLSRSVSRTNSEQDLALGAVFLQESTALSAAQVKRLSQMGATVRNSSKALETIEHRDRQHRAARVAMDAMDTPDLEELKELYSQLSDLAGSILQRRAEPAFVGH